MAIIDEGGAGQQPEQEQSAPVVPENHGGVSSAPVGGGFVPQKQNVQKSQKTTGWGSGMTGNRQQVMDANKTKLTALGNIASQNANNTYQKASSGFNNTASKGLTAVGSHKENLAGMAYDNVGDDVYTNKLLRLREGGEITGEDQARDLDTSASAFRNSTGVIGGPQDISSTKNLLSGLDNREGISDIAMSGDAALLRGSSGFRGDMQEVGDKVTGFGIDNKLSAAKSNLEKAVNSVNQSNADLREKTFGNGGTLSKFQEKMIKDNEAKVRAERQWQINSQIRALDREGRQANTKYADIDKDLIRKMGNPVNSGEGTAVGDTYKNQRTSNSYRAKKAREEYKQKKADALAKGKAFVNSDVSFDRADQAKYDAIENILKGYK